MANIKISELPVATTVADADVLVVNQGGVTKQAARSLVNAPSGTLGVANGGTGRTAGNYSIYGLEIHVGKDGNDTTGDGTLINPVLTITKALTLIGSGRNTIVVHPGEYSESPTVSGTNTTITTTELTGANTLLSGTLTLNAAARVSGLKMSNLTITGTGNTYISNCTVDVNVTKSGSNYVEIINSELQCTSGIQITGAGIVSIVGNKCWAVAVSNAAANVLVKDCFQVIAPSVTAGTLQFDGCAIFGASPSTNAVSSSAGTTITLANSFVLNSVGTNAERVSLLGSYSILNLVYDKANSTLTGTNLNAIDYFSVINADTLNLTNKLSVANGGTGVAVSTGVNSVVLRDADENIGVNAVFQGFEQTTASGTLVTLTRASAPSQVVIGSGGQVIMLPDATALPNGTVYTFRNNQSSGAISIKDGSDTVIGSIPATGVVSATLLTNGFPAGSWSFSAAGASVVQTFTSSGTWTKPAGAVAVDVVVISAGGGGGSGRKAGVASQASGGGGGGGGSYSFRNISTALLGATESVTVGSGGTGGASVTVNSTNGNIGVAGGNSSFGAWIQVTGGGGAGAATNTNGPAGSGSSSRAMFQGGNGSAGGAGAGTLTGGSNVNISGAGGGAGGGLPAAATVGFTGSTGGTCLGSWFSGGTANGGAIGGNGASAPNVAAGFAASGSAGGGGGSSVTGNAGNGGNGGLYGGAGGGGGAGLDSVGNSGAGGNGADGIVVVTTYF